MSGLIRLRVLRDTEKQERLSLPGPVKKETKDLKWLNCKVYSKVRPFIWTLERDRYGISEILAKMKLFNEGEVTKERVIISKNSRDTQITLKKPSKWRQLISPFSVSMAENTCVIDTKLDGWGMERQVWLRGAFACPLLTMGEGARVKNAVDSHLIVRHYLKVRVVCQILKTVWRSVVPPSSGSRSPSGILLNCLRSENKAWKLHCLLKIYCLLGYYAKENA